MLKSAVGVDLGSSALKVVELRGTWRKPEVVRAVERKLPAENANPCSPEQIAQALTEVLSAHAMKPTRVVSAISAHSTFVRNLQLPFRDPRKIRDMLKFELEPHIPYPVEDVSVDFAMVRETAAGGCEILAVAVPKAAMAEHLRIFDLAGLVPEPVDWEVFGELNSYQAWRGAAPGLVASVNMGASKTTIKLIKGGRILFTRSIARGGNALTEAIRRRFTLTTAQAEALKLSTSEKERSQIAESIGAFLGMLAKEIDHTLLAFATREEDGETVQEFVLHGGGAKLPEALPFFQERYAVPTMVFDADHHLFAPSPLALQGGTGSTMSVAMGLALRQLSRRTVGLDFRREEFTLRKSYEAIRGHLISAGALITLLVGLSLFDLYYHLHTKEIRYTQLRSQVEAIFRDTFPDVRRISNEVAQAREKLREIETNLKGVGILSGPQGSSLELLRELSLRMPQNLQVKVVDLTISTEGISMSGETQSFEGVDSLKQAFASSPYFDDVKVSQARAGLNGKGVEFKISMTLKKS